MNKKIEQHLIEAGVKNLREFGYPQCNEENIITDAIFKQFFVSMLKDNMGKNSLVDEIIKALLKRIEEK